jgi:hypothetical protein
MTRASGATSRWRPSRGATPDWAGETAPLCSLLVWIPDPRPLVETSEPCIRRPHWGRLMPQASAPPDPGGCHGVSSSRGGGSSKKWLQPAKAPKAPACPTLQPGKLPDRGAPGPN